MRWKQSLKNAERADVDNVKNVEDRLLALEEFCVKLQTRCERAEAARRVAWPHATDDIVAACFDTMEAA